MHQLIDNRLEYASERIGGNGGKIRVPFDLFSGIMRLRDAGNTAGDGRTHFHGRNGRSSSEQCGDERERLGGSAARIGEQKGRINTPGLTFYAQGFQLPQLFCTDQKSSIVAYEGEPNLFAFITKDLADLVLSAVDFIGFINSNPRWRRLARRQRTDANYLSRPHGRQRCEAFWHDRKEILNPIVLD